MEPRKTFFASALTIFLVFLTFASLNLVEITNVDTSKDVKETTNEYACTLPPIVADPIKGEASESPQNTIPTRKRSSGSGSSNPSPSNNQENTEDPSPKTETNFSEISFEIEIDAGENRREHVEQELLFVGEAFHVDSEIVKYEWDFDSDGVVDSNLPITTYTYHAEGVYEVEFKATNDLGESKSDFIEVKIEEDFDDETVGGLSIPGEVLTKPADGNEEYYAIMINGGYERKYWEDVEEFYSTLTEKYGLTHDKISLINHNGLNPSGENPDNMIDYSAREENMEIAFREIAEKMDGDDTLILWVDDHGAGYYGPNSYSDAIFHGYLAGRVSIDPGDEEDYLERDFKLRSLSTSTYGYGAINHGMNKWVVTRKFTTHPARGYKYIRTKYVSNFTNVNVNGTNLSDQDVFIERFEDFLAGDLNKNRVIEEGEVEDFDGDGIPPYDPDTGEFDEDDWKGIDYFKDNHQTIGSRAPGDSYYCLFDHGFDNRIDIDINCKCSYSDYFRGTCDPALLEVDGTDLDNQGLFDGIDINEDGDMDDWASIDESVSLYVGNLWDDDLRDHLNLFDIKNVISIFQSCFSGGFIEDLSKNNTIIMTATVEEDVAWGTFFLDRFRDALENNTLADANHDHKASITEIFNYLAENNPTKAVHQYDDNGDKISNSYRLPKGGDGIFGANTFIKTPPAPPACAAGGCSKSLCMDAEEAGKSMSSCEWEERFLCLELTNCGYYDGECKWEETDEYLQCLSEF